LSFPLAFFQRFVNNCAVRGGIDSFLAHPRPDCGAAPPNSPENRSMSFDCFFFRLADGIDVEELNQFLSSADYEEYLDEGDDSAAAGDEPLLVPARFLDLDLDEEELNELLTRAGEELNKPELNDFLQEALAEAAEFNGMLQITVGNNDHPRELLRDFAEILKRLEADRIALFLDETSQAYDAANADELAEVADQPTHDFELAYDEDEMDDQDEMDDDEDLDDDSEEDDDR